MIESFKDYLIKKNYKEFTPSGNPSTVYDYSKRVIRICERERISIQELADDIDLYVSKYGPDGKESEFGKKSHNAFISALRCFKRFSES